MIIKEELIKEYFDYMPETLYILLKNYRFSQDELMLMKKELEHNKSIGVKYEHMVDPS